MAKHNKSKDVYSVLDKGGNEVFSGDFASLRKFFYAVGEITIKKYIEAGGTPGGYIIRLKSCAVEEPGNRTYMDSWFFKEWEEACKPFRELSKKRKGKR